MPRKRIKGRAKLPSITNQLEIQLNKSNRRLRELEKNRQLGTYSSRQFIYSMQHSKAFSYSRRRNKQIIKLIQKDIKEPEARLALKEIQKFLRSKTSTKIGIAETKQRTKETLARITDKDIDDEDLETFYNLFGKSDFDYFAEKIGASLVIVLLVEAEEGAPERFIELLEQYMTMNDENVRNKARRLFNKYISGKDFKK